MSMTRPLNRMCCVQRFRATQHMVQIFTVEVLSTSGPLLCVSQLHSVSFQRPGLAKAYGGDQSVVNYTNAKAA